MHPDDTIIAPATPPGHARRAIIRLSGPGVASALAHACVAPPSPGAHAARVRLGPDRTLPVLVLRSVGGRSYTGEPAAEILCPSNPTLIERVIAVFLESPGVRPAGPGEFTARAYLHGKLSLDQAEGVAARIAARTDEQLAAASDLLSGRAGDRARGASESIAALLALVEAGVDFTDEEDVQPIPPAELASRLAQIQADLHAPAPASVEQGRPLVVLAGRASVGKSTLFNALLGRRRAVTHAEPGTTRDVLTEPLALSPEVGAPCVVDLADAAGLEATSSDPAAEGAMAAARRAIERADLVLHCDDRGAFGDAPAEGALRVRTKWDRAEQSSASSDAVPVCALDGAGLPELRAAIADRLHASSRAASSGARGLALPEHRRALAAAAEALADTSARIDTRARSLAEPELVAGGLRAALDALAPLAGRVTPDDVLGRVFASFCIGK